MRLQSTVAVIGPLVALSCAGPAASQHAHDRPLSVAEHEAEAQRHERVAADHERSYEPRADLGSERMCANGVVPGPSSGGEEMRVMRPCWTHETNPTALHLREADINRREADKHRGEAAALLGAEKRSCAGLGAAEIDHSPFYHREDIVRVEPLLEGRQIRGARVLFRAVPGLSARWLERASRCHLARAAVMGYSDTFMPYCPLALREVEVAIEDTDEGLWIVVRSSRPASAAAIWGRVQALGDDERGRAPAPLGVRDR